MKHYPKKCFNMAEDCNMPQYVKPESLFTFWRTFAEMSTECLYSAADVVLKNVRKLSDFVKY